MSTHPIPVPPGAATIDPTAPGGMPGGADPADECTQLGRHGDSCLQRLRDGYNLPADLCDMCRLTFRQLLDSVLGGVS